MLRRVFSSAALSTLVLLSACESQLPTSSDRADSRIDESPLGSIGGPSGAPAPDGSAGPAASPVVFLSTVFNTDFVAAGVGAMRDQPGPHTIGLAGVSGPVTQAVLYWHGPTRSADPAANANVMMDGNPVVGTNIGLSSDNCWGFQNSQAYRADVTALVAGKGNGNYSLSGFGSGSVVNTNGASLVVYYDDGNPANNRDVAVFDGNDSNISNPFDPAGWHMVLAGINYTGGTAGMQLHIADGQSFSDDALRINGNVKIPTGNWVAGFSVPGVNNGPTNNGRLWDIINVDVTPDLIAAGAPPQALTLTSGLSSDCLALVVSIVDLPAGAAPNQPNAPPVADAGADQTIEWTTDGAGATTLDGSGSSDPDGDALTYSWSEGGSEIATGVSPTVNLSLGTHAITLTVDDGNGASDTDDVVIDVVDTTPPDLTLTVSPGSLWPPNHKYAAIDLSALVSDDCDPDPGVEVWVESGEPDNAIGNGDGNTTGDVRVTLSDGTVLLSSDPDVAVHFDLAELDELELRSERDGTNPGRTYAITVTATDASGNESEETVAVTVPHDQS